MSTPRNLAVLDRPVAPLYTPRSKGGTGGNEMAAKQKVTNSLAGAKKAKKATKWAPRRPQSEAVNNVSTRSVLDGSMKSLVRERFLKRLRG